MAVGLSESYSYPGHSPHTNHYFAVLPPERPQKSSTKLFEIGRSFSLFSCFSFASLLILLLLMSRKVHPNPGPVFPCSGCARNVTWRGRSVQCSTCSKWIQLRCSLLFFSRFKTLSSSHSWSCTPWCVPASSGDPTPTKAVTSSSSLYTSTVPPGRC